MSAHRIKVISAALKSDEQVRAAIAETVWLQIDREQRVAQRDRRLQAVTARYEAQITEGEKKIEENLALLEQWSDVHRERFGRERSLEIDGHRLGWRLGNPRATTAKKVTWARVLDLLLVASSEVRNRFVRTKHELNKEALIAARETDADLLRTIGVEVVQTETFYLDPNREGQESPRLAGGGKEVAP